MELPEAFKEYEHVQIWIPYSRGWDNSTKHPLNCKTLGGTCEKYNGAGTYIQAVSRIGDTSEKFGKVVGVGFYFKKAGLVGFDFDHCIRDGIIIDPEVESIVKALSSYTEYSPSKTGLHIICKADFATVGKIGIKVSIPNTDLKRELYNSDRFFTLTGDIYGDYSRIEDRTDIIPDIISKYYVPYQTTRTVKTSGKKKMVPVARMGLTPAAKAIKSHDWKYFRNKWKPERKTFENVESFFKYIYCELNLADFLEVEEGTPFNCFFHEEQRGSAFVYRDNKVGGKWLYKCYGAGCYDRPFTIKQVCEILGQFQSEYESKEFIKKALNIQIEETDWTREQLDILNDIEDKIIRCDSESFAAICPSANANLHHGKMIFLAIINHAKKSIYPRKYLQDKPVIFQMSVRTLAKESDRKGTSPDRINQWISAFCRHGMLLRVSDKAIPEPLLYAASKQSGKDRNHCNFYMLFPFVIERLLFIQYNGNQWQQLGYTVGKMRYKTILDAEGQEMADRIFTQPKREAKEKGLRIKTMTASQNEAAELQSDRINDIFYDCIKEYGYVTPRMITEQYKARFKPALTQAKVKEHFPELIAKYGLLRVRAKDDLKLKYGIVTKSARSYPTIYILPESED